MSSLMLHNFLRFTWCSLAMDLTKAITQSWCTQGSGEVFVWTMMLVAKQIEWYVFSQDHDVDHAVKRCDFLAKPTKIIVRALSLQASNMFSLHSSKSEKNWHDTYCESKTNDDQSIGFQVVGKPYTCVVQIGVISAHLILKDLVVHNVK